MTVVTERTAHSEYVYAEGEIAQGHSWDRAAERRGAAMNHASLVPKKAPRLTRYQARVSVCGLRFLRICSSIV